MDQHKIGKIISQKRKEKGMTQEQLGECLKTTGKTISRWETGKYMPDISLLIPISEILEISLEELLSGEENNHDTSKLIIEYSEKESKLKQKILTLECYVYLSLLIIQYMFFKNTSAFDLLTFAIPTIVVFIYHRYRITTNIICFSYSLLLYLNFNFSLFIYIIIISFGVIIDCLKKNRFKK